MDKDDLNIIMKWIAVVIGAIFIFGLVGVQYTKTVGKAQADVEREVFKETTTYNETMAAFLADCYKQYNDAETESGKTAIMEYVVMRYPNVDYNKIENSSLKEFYRDCLNYRNK